MDQKPKEAPKSLSPVERIAQLEAELAIERQARADSQEEQARQLAQAQSVAIQMSNIKEVLAGSTLVERRDAKGEVVTKRVPVLEPDGAQRVEDGRKVWETEPVTDEVEVYWYKIELPPSAGMAVSVNGQELFHGQTYKFTMDSLRTVKELVYRSWAHERSIHTNEENIYRPRQAARV